MHLKEGFCLNTTEFVLQGVKIDKKVSAIIKKFVLVFICICTVCMETHKLCVY